MAKDKRRAARRARQKRAAWAARAVAGVTRPLGLSDAERLALADALSDSFRVEAVPGLDVTHRTPRLPPELARRKKP